MRWWVEVNDEVVKGESGLSFYGRFAFLRECVEPMEEGVWWRRVGMGGCTFGGEEAGAAYFTEEWEDCATMEGVNGED